jgi:hypothetical protein
MVLLLFNGAWSQLVLTRSTFYFLTINHATVASCRFGAASTLWSGHPNDAASNM